MSETIRYCRVRVSGRVQGVGFRMATWHAARRLGLRGYAENLADGDVEVFAFGQPDPLRELLDWLEEGPPAARVTSVSSEEVQPPAELPDGFEIR